MAAAGAALRLRLLCRMLRAGEVLALVALVSWSSSYVPSAVAAALRLAGSLLLNARFVFVLGNAIVLLLFALSRHDLSSSPSSGDKEQPATASASTATASQQQAAAPVAASAGFASFTTDATLPSNNTVEEAATPTTPPPPAMGGAAVPARRPEPEPVGPRTVAAAPSTVVFEDKQPVRVSSSKARAPRRSRSEKLGGAPPRRRAASPELRRCESENGRRRRSSVSARDAEACCWDREDADELRRQVEAFIDRQTRFHREESMTMAVAGHCEAAPAFTAALAAVE